MRARTRSRLLLAVAALGVVAAIVPIGGPVDATEQGNLGTISPSRKHLEKEVLPMAGIYPGTLLPTQPFAIYRPPICRTATYCDAVQFEVDYPDALLGRELFGVSITLSWDNPRGNDLDMFVWGDDDPAAGAPLSTKCATPPDDPCDKVHPEVISISEPPRTVPEDADIPAIFLTVVNETGVNTGYKIEVDWFTLELPKIPKFSPPKRDTSTLNPDQVAGPFDFDISTGSGGPTTPAPTPRTILVPGSDGELHEVDLPLFAAGQRVGSTVEEKSGISPWVTGAIAGVLALSGLTIFLIRRNQRIARD